MIVCMGVGVIYLGGKLKSHQSVNAVRFFAYPKCAQGLVQLEIGRLKAGSWLSSRKTSQNSQVSGRWCINKKWEADDIKLRM